MRSLATPVLMFLLLGAPALGAEGDIAEPAQEAWPESEGAPGGESRGETGPWSEAWPDQQQAPSESEPAEIAPDPTVEDLLAELAQAETGEDARVLERRIYDRWTHSGSATADLLLQRSGEAMEKEDPDTALELLDKLTELAPDFAEGWHMRARVAVEASNFEEAVVSLRHTLSLEPSHFVAMAELGSILEDFGDNENALSAYRQALALNPFIDGVEERIRELARDVEGQGI